MDIITQTFREHFDHETGIYTYDCNIMTLSEYEEWQSHEHDKCQYSNIYE